MAIVRKLLYQFLSFGIRPQLSEGKKLAIQLATLDAYWSLAAIMFYTRRSIELRTDFITWAYSVALFLVLLGLWFFRKGFYDSGRILIHVTTLACIFLGVDSSGINSGAEYYYFTSIAIPFVIFTTEEQWKGNFLTLLAGSVFLSQLILGPGLFMKVVPTEAEDRMGAAMFVGCYFLLIFGVGRRQLKIAHLEIERQYGELIQSSKMIALGELSSSIAHEINNPLQSLTLQLKVMKEKFQVPELGGQIDRMDNLIFKMALMVKGLKDLSRNSSLDPEEEFTLSENLDDVMNLVRNRLQEEDIRLTISGEQGHLLRGKQVQVSQVMINLLNNAIDAIKGLPEKWIKIEIAEKGGMLEMRFSDSGHGIPPEIKSQMMNPFFTTKSPSKGTGLGLTISKSLIEKNGGRLFYDDRSPRTTFVVVLPLAPMNHRA